MASDQLETGCAAAATAPELRLYHFGYEGASCVARLDLCSSLPAAVPHADAAVDGLAEDSHIQPGFYLAVLDVGMIFEVGRLSSLDGRRFGASAREEPAVDDRDATGRSKRSISEDKEAIMGKEEDSSREEEEISVEEEEEGRETTEEEGDETSVEEEEEGEETSVEKEEETSVEEEVEGDETTEEEAEETSVEEELEGLESSAEKEDEWEKSSSEDDSKDSGNQSFLHLRIWPGTSHAIIVLFDGGCWHMTKSFSVKWLQSQEKLEVLRIIDKDLADDDAMSCKAIASSLTNSSHWFKGCTLRLDFEGLLLYPHELEEALNRELNPTLDDFKIIKQLGKGAAGKVYQCVYKDAHIHTPYAIKIVKIYKDDDIDGDGYLNKEPREVNTMSCFNNPKIVRFYKAWITSECYENNVDQDDDSDAYSDIQSDSDVSESDPNGPAYVVIQMEYCIRTVGKSSIGQHEVNIEQSWTLFEKITQALGLIHEKGLIHRDVKPSNILVGEDEEVKIGDFGHACWASCYKNGGKGTPDCGTTFYMAPELDQGLVTDKVDIYSLGVTLLEIFCSFGSLHERASVMQDLKNGKYPTNFSGDIDLLKKLTASCPPQRPSTVDILEYIAQRQ